MQHVHQLALVLMDALDLHIKQAGRVDADAGGLVDQRGQALLVVRFDRTKFGAEPRVVGFGHQAAQQVQVTPPGGTQRAVDQLGEAGVGLGQPAARRDTVGHVGEALRPQRGKVGKDGFHQQIAVQLGDTIHLVAAHDRQVGHAHPALAALVDEAQAALKLHVARPQCLRHHQKFMVDAEDDFQVARQHMLHQRHRPGFQRFGHQRVVGVAEGVAGDFPGRCPGEPMLVHQQAHQLGHADGGVGVVQVDGHLVGQVGQAAVLSEMAGQDVLDAGAGEEIFLAQPQFAPGGCAVVGVEHPGDVLELVLELGRAGVVARIERGEVDVGRRGGFPQAQGAHALGAMAGDHVVIGLGVHLAGMAPHRHGVG